MKGVLSFVRFGSLILIFHTLQLNISVFQIHWSHFSGL